MKHATFSKSALLVTAILTSLTVVTLSACAASDPPTTEDTTPTQPAPADTTSKLPPTAPTGTTAPAKVCVAKCTADTECASSCPALAGGVQCCDLKTNTCWGSKTSSCPAQVDPDSGAPPPAY